MKLRLGTNCSPRGIQPEAVLGIITAISALDSAQPGVLWISSITDREHSIGSLHYTGAAFDLVLDADSPTQATYADSLQLYLGPEYDVIDEGDHVHVEWQPKRPSE